MSEQPALIPGIRAPFTVDRIVEDTTHLVEVTPNAYTLLGQLTGALADNPAARAEFAVAMLNTNPNRERVALALRTLAQMPDVVEALTTILHPQEAQVLRDELDDAQVRPDDCTGCGVRLAVEGGLCALCGEEEGR